MGNEINLMKNYPKSKRDIKSRGNSKTQIDRKIAREFGKEFFDGNRSQGYGGFNYDPKYWKEVIPDFQKHFNLSSKDSILDVGCAKGFMIFDATATASRGFFLLEMRTLHPSLEDYSRKKAYIGM